MGKNSAILLFLSLLPMTAAAQSPDAADDSARPQTPRDIVADVAFVCGNWKRESLSIDLQSPEQSFAGLVQSCHAPEDLMKYCAPALTQAEAQSLMELSGTARFTYLGNVCTYDKLTAAATDRAQGLEAVVRDVARRHGTLCGNELPPVEQRQLAQLPLAEQPQWLMSHCDASSGAFHACKSRLTASVRSEWPTVPVAQRGPWLDVHCFGKKTPQSQSMAAGALFFVVVQPVAGTAGMSETDAAFLNQLLLETIRVDLPAPRYAVFAADKARDEVSRVVRLDAVATATPFQGGVVVQVEIRRTNDGRRLAMSSESAATMAEMAGLLEKAAQRSARQLRTLEPKPAPDPANTRYQPSSNAFPQKQRKGSEHRQLGIYRALGHLFFWTGLIEAVAGGVSFDDDTATGAVLLADGGLRAFIGLAFGFARLSESAKIEKTERYRATSMTAQMLPMLGLSAGGTAGLTLKMTF